jgi:hypothetical protein
MEGTMEAYKSYQKRRNHCRTRLVYGAFGMFLLLSMPAPASPSDESPVILSQTPMELKPYAIALGQRLCRPGKERIVASGSLTYFGDNPPQTEAVRITWQFPLKARLERDGTLLAFDRSNPRKAMPEAKKAVDTIQLLLEDSVEGLYALQKERISRRYLGSGFKLEGVKASDPGMDVVLMTYPDHFHNEQPIQKSYWFDSGTKLLGVVAYTSASGAAMHIVISDWRDVAGEKFPFCIERWEDNKLKIRLVLDSAAFMAGANDGTFGGK